MARFGATQGMRDVSQGWKPDRPVRIVAGTPPGGGLDRAARAIAKALGQGPLIEVPVEIVNIPGGGARRAWTHYIDNHPGDAHVLGISSPNLTTDYLVGAATFEHSKYVPIATLLTEYIAFAVQSDSRMQTGADQGRRGFARISRHRTGGVCGNAGRAWPSEEIRDGRMQACALLRMRSAGPDPRLAHISRAWLALPLTNTYLLSMRLSPAKVSALALVLFFCAFAPQQASAQSRNYRIEPSPVPSIMVDETTQTPVIMQGLERPKKANRGSRHTNKEANKEAERRVHIPRGSASFVPPASSTAPLPRTPLLTQPAAAAPYNPPPISNPSERITQFNQSFQFNRGLGNNPTDRDGYVRYNFNR